MAYSRPSSLMATEQKSPPTSAQRVFTVKAVGLSVSSTASVAPIHTTRPDAGWGPCAMKVTGEGPLVEPTSARAGRV